MVRKAYDAYMNWGMVDGRPTRLNQALAAATWVAIAVYWVAR